MTDMKFFGYGAMTDGLVHFSKIKEFISDSIPAKAKGTAYRLQVGYPVLLEDGNCSVPGFLVILRATDLLINLLDEFHGYNRMDESKSLYFRREISVQSEHGEENVSAYVLNPTKLPKTATLIENGDWISSLRTVPALPETLTTRQKHYISKLGAVTGREIVPINDLSLYRELMNLELIVDKGRRLALSKLGHEVFRYLD